MKRQMETVRPSCDSVHGEVIETDPNMSIGSWRNESDMCTDPKAGLKSPITAHISAAHLLMMWIQALPTLKGLTRLCLATLKGITSPKHENSDIIDSHLSCFKSV